MGAPRHTEDKVEASLRVLSVVGSCTRAAEQTGVPEKTLRNWRDKTHADRYQELRRTYAPQVHAKLATKYEDIAYLAADKVLEGLEHLDPGSLKFKQADLAKVVKDTLSTSAWSVDKARLSRDMPTHIVERQDATELVGTLKRLAPGMVVDSTATEITEGAG